MELKSKYTHAYFNFCKKISSNFVDLQDSILQNNSSHYVRNEAILALQLYLGGAKNKIVISDNW